MVDIHERVAKLEADNVTRTNQVDEIFEMLHRASEALVRLTTLQEKQHSPETCPNTCKVNRMYPVYLAIVGITAALVSLGIIGKVGEWLWTQIVR